MQMPSPRLSLPTASEAGIISLGLSSLEKPTLAGLPSNGGDVRRGGSASPGWDGGQLQRGGIQEANFVEATFSVRVFFLGTTFNEGAEAGFDPLRSSCQKAAQGMNPSNCR
jgi:hypothetical protein